MSEQYLTTEFELNIVMPPYSEIELKDEDVATKVHELLSSQAKIDVYCIWCKKETVFNNIQRLNDRFEHWIPFTRYTKVEYECTRDASHTYFIIYYKNDEKFLKIGQYPSVADIQIPQTQKYRSILGDELYIEYTKGLGLFAHGVGIGSFVYLRRIFEKLIANEKEAAIKHGKLSEEEYNKARMDERIEMLKEYLPEFLVETKSIYSILSTGLHDLTEAECLKYFIPVKLGIEQILDEKLIAKQQSIKKEQAKKAIASITQELSKRK